MRSHRAKQLSSPSSVYQRTLSSYDGPLPEPATEIGDWQDWPFSLTDYLPSAQRASGGRPDLVIWHFHLPAG